MTPEPGCIGKRQIDAIDKNTAAFRYIKPLDELGERAFARTRRPDDAHDLPRGDRKGDIAQDFRPIDAVAERHMLENDLAPERRKRRTSWRKQRLGRRVENIAEPGHRDAGLVKILPDLRKTQDRLADAARKHVEGHEFTDGEAAFHDIMSAEEQKRRRSSACR